MRKSPALLIFFLILLSAIAQTGCHSRDRDAIKKVIEERAKAMRDRDLNRYMKHISNSYRGTSASSKEELRRTMKDIFSSVEEIDLSVYNMAIYPYGTTALVVENFVLHYSMEGKKISQRGVERIELVKEKGEWRIKGGL